MTKAEFEKLLIGYRGSNIVIDLTNKWSFHDLMNFRKIFKYIDFRCEFKDSYCKRFKNSNIPSCCCNDCHDKVGYLDIVPSHKIGFYARKFSKKTGFWRKNGCNLPHEYRSRTCLTFHCNSSDSGNADWYDKDFSSAISEQKRQLNRLEGNIY